MIDMSWNTFYNLGILWLLLSIQCCKCFHCGWDEDLAEGSTDIQYSIDTKPKLNKDQAYWITDGDHVGTGNNYAAIQPRYPNHNYYIYWPSNMEFYLFGKILSAAATIMAGFYDTDGNLVYGAVIDCAAGTWKTQYKNTSYTTNQDWKTGKLLKKCKTGSIFDLVYEIQQRQRGKFVFNGQPLERGLYPKYKMDQRTRQNEWTGLYRIGRLPVDLTGGTEVKATVSGATLTRYAYGKCYAFPYELRRNCTEALEWIMARNKMSNKNLERTEEPKYVDEPAQPPEIEDFGLNGKYANVDCWATGSKYFHMIQKGIHSDQNSDTMPYCCCSYMNGTLAEDTCVTFKSTCTMTCLAYSLYKIKYEGLEKYYLGDLSGAELKAKIKAMNSATVLE